MGCPACRLLLCYSGENPAGRHSAEMDSPLEGTGFEPSVPRGKGPTLRVSVLFRSDFSVGGNQPEATLKDWSCHAGPMVRILFPPAESQAISLARQRLRVRVPVDRDHGF